MGDLNRDIRVVWERDYSHLMYRRKDTPRNYFGYSGYEFPFCEKNKKVNQKEQSK